MDKESTKISPLAVFILALVINDFFIDISPEAILILKSSISLFSIKRSPLAKLNSPLTTFILSISKSPAALFNINSSIIVPSKLILTSPALVSIRKSSIYLEFGEPLMSKSPADVLIDKTLTFVEFKIIFKSAAERSNLRSLTSSFIYRLTGIS